MTILDISTHIKPCKICPYTWENTQSITGTASKFNHEIKEAVTCDSSNCIYYWRCVKPNCPDFPKCEYVGKTTRKFKDRLAEHRDYPKRDMITETGNISQSLGMMFPI